MYHILMETSKLLQHSNKTTTIISHYIPIIKRLVHNDVIPKIQLYTQYHYQYQQIPTL